MKTVFTKKQRQWFWFAVLWLAGLAAVSLLALAIRFLFVILGLT